MMILFIVLGIYAVSIGVLILGFTKMKPIHFHNAIPQTRFSIVVPFRNEAQNLPRLLASLEALDYPKNQFEVILVDDASEDDFVLPKTKSNMRIIVSQRKTNSPKKDAINTAITLAKYEWIITTDADCVVHFNWLKVYDNYIQQTDRKMVAAGVCYAPKKGFLHAFQNLDLLSLQGATIGSFGVFGQFMCNGANFAYQKEFFFALNGFEGNENIASGDDVFLLQKAVKKDKKKVGFCMHENSIVVTQSLDSWKDLFFQRVRWAAKSPGYSSRFGKFLALVVFGTNVALLAALLLWLFKRLDANYFMLFLGIKFFVDFVLISLSARHFHARLNGLLAASLLHPFFNFTVGLYSLLGSYQWKGRTFRK